MYESGPLMVFSAPEGTLPQVSQFLNRVSVSSTRVGLYTALITTLVNAGIWNFLDSLYIFDTDNSSAALQNLISSNFTAVVHGTMTFTASAGYAGNGTSGYLDSTLNPSSSPGINYSLNSASMGLYATGSTFSIMGATNAGTGDASYIYNAANGGTYYTFENALNENSATFMGGPIVQGSQNGLLAASRTGSSLESSYFNGSVVYAQATDASTTVPTTSILIGAVAAFSAFSACQMSAAWIGGGLTDAQVATLSAAINTYLTVDAVNTYPIALSSGSMASGGSVTVPSFGINAHPLINGVTTVPPASIGTMLAYLGVTDVRINATDWAQVEPATKGVYVWDNSGGGSPFGDPYINGASGLRTGGYIVNVALEYSNTLYESSYFTAPTDAPGRTGFSNYAAAVAGRYGATRMIYEIWNEENVSNGAGQYSWAPAANAANYATLFTSAAAAIVGAASGANVISGGVQLASGSGYIAPTTFISTFLADATLTNLSNVAYHAYTGVIGGGQSPELQATQSIQTFQTSAGGTYGVKLIVNEYGFTTYNCNNSETLKAVMNMRATLWMACLGGIAKLLPYELAPSNESYEYFDASYNPLPSAVAYKAVIAAFSGAISVSYYTKTYNSAYPQFFLIVIEKSATSYVVIAWPSVSTFNFTYAAGANLLSFPATDLFGNAVAVSNDGSGNLTFQVVDVNGPVILTLTYS